MTIYKLEQIIDSIRGNCTFQKKDLLDEGKYLALHYGKTYKMDFVCDDYNFYVNENFFKKDQIVKKDDIVIVSTSETIEDLGHCYFYNNSEKDGLLGGEQILLKTSNLVESKWLFYWIKQNKKIFRKFATGLSVYRFKINDFKFIEIDLPTLSEQNKIIDIIEPIEELYLKYSNVVDISNIENTKNDIKKIIDIIEPIENLVNMSKYTLENLLNVIKGLKIKNNTVFLKDITTPTQNKPKNIIQVSAKVMNKRNPIINKFEDKGTYGTNTFNCEKGTLLINTIRTYLNKFAILPSEADVNGTSIQLKVDNNFETSILHALLNDNFWSKTELLSQGTKMPVIKKSDILDIEINVVENNINNVFDVVINLNNMIIRLEEMKEKILKILIK